jgi:hypothetical protein
LDYFGARYYASAQGRFMSADEFSKDSQLEDPQSWNKFAYVRNNPLFYVDPSGEKAEVIVTTDKEHKKGTITIRASFAIYAASGQTVSKEDLQKQKKALEEQIRSTYSGSIKKDGITYEVSAQVKVQIVDNEESAIKSGVDNIVEVGNRVLHSNAANGPIAGAGYHLSGENFDRMKVFARGNVLEKNNTYAHEFGHLLGFAGHLGVGNVMQPSGASTRTITSMDSEALFGSRISGHNNLYRAFIPAFVHTPFKTSGITQAPTVSSSRIVWR